METIKKYLDYLLKGSCAALFAALVILVTWQVFTRFVLNAPSTFSEELSTLCFVWLAVLGAALVFGENGHMAMDFVKNRFPRRFKMGVEVLIHVTTMVFAALALVMGGSELAKASWHQATGSIGIPLGIQYLVLPLSGAFIIFYSIHSIIQIIRLKLPLEDIPGAVRPEVAE